MEPNTFGKYEIKITPEQAQLLLDLINKIDMSEMTPQDVMVANSLHYSLQMVKEQKVGELA